MISKPGLILKAGFILLYHIGTFQCLQWSTDSGCGFSTLPFHCKQSWAIC